MKQAGWQNLKSDVKTYWKGILAAAVFLMAMLLLFGQLCPLRILVGLSCPACGLTRAGLYVLSLQFHRAWEMNPVIFLIPGIAFALVWYFQAFRSDIEYEYTYYDGEFRFARIKAKSKRKAIGSVQMDDVLGFAPKGDRSVYKYENDKNLAYKDLTSGDPDAKVYELIAKGEKGLVRYEFEPDDEMLDEVMVKYPRSVVR